MENLVSWTSLLAVQRERITNLPAMVLLNFWTKVSHVGLLGDIFSVANERHSQLLSEWTQSINSLHGYQQQKSGMVCPTWRGIWHYPRLSTTFCKDFIWKTSDFPHYKFFKFHITEREDFYMIDQRVWRGGSHKMFNLFFLSNITEYTNCQYTNTAVLTR